MSDFDRYTRVNKFEKRRKNTKAISLLLVLSGLLLIVLLGIWLFGGNDEEEASENANTPNETETNDVESEEGINDEDNASPSENENSSTVTDNEEDDESSNTEESNEEDMYSEDIETEETEVTSDDDNVLEAYTGNWPPVGTEQEGPHTTVFEQDSLDWKEMEKAFRLATGLQEENMTTWWIGNGGDQKAIGTVSDKAQTEIYRVYISWIDNQGWKPTLVEVLQEVDYD